MKKIILMFALLIGFVVGTKAQVAIENPKAFDNISIGVNTGVSTPMDFNSMFPLNWNLGIMLQKDFTPIVGLQVEGIILWNDNHFSDLKTAAKGTNVGVNGVINLSNAICGYKGTPRLFEVSTVAGLGWLRTWDTPANFLTAKTGLDLAFNLGNTKAHSIVITPAVYWNLSKLGKVQLYKNNAQLAIAIGYRYHFKTSNGTHGFKLWPVGDMVATEKALNEEINKQRKELAQKDQIIQQQAQANKALTEANDRKQGIIDGLPKEVVVLFAQNSAELTSDAKAKLDAIKGMVTIEGIEGTASPEGTEDFNQTLSEKRAQAVADYLANRGIQVKTAPKGVGVQGDASNRTVVVKLGIIE